MVIIFKLLGEINWGKRGKKIITWLTRVTYTKQENQCSDNKTTKIIESGS